MIGVQNVDTIQEVQVLTANYMPEYGRASGGQIRFVTKSGSNRYSGNASYFCRDDSLQANTWARNQSTERGRELAVPAPFDYKQYGYSFGGPIPGAMFKDKLFFFGAQEWVNFFAVADQHRDRSDRGDAPRRLQPAPRLQPVLQHAADHPQSGVTSLPFENNVIPSQHAVAERRRADEHSTRCRRAGFQQGASNSILNSDNPQDQRKDHIRFDYRLNQGNQITYRYSKQNWVAIDAFRGTFPFARTDWDRPNTTQNINWTSHDR